MLVDSHCHLDSTSDLEAVISRAKSEGIDKIITVGTSIESSKKSIDISDKYSSDDLKIYATIGMHPKDGKNDVERFGLYQCINTLKQLVKSSEKVVGVGECGLDYYEIRDKRQAISDKDKKYQKELFEAQVKLASELDLSLIIHCRNAWSEIFDLLSKYNNYSSSGAKLSREAQGQFSTSSNNKLRGVFHSWTGDWQAAKKALSLGFYISFSGIVTFKNTQDIQEVVKKVPLERILIETDSPYLSPEPFRGAKNEPKNVRIVAQFVADLYDLPFDKIAEETSQNTRQLFGI